MNMARYLTLLVLLLGVLATQASSPGNQQTEVPDNAAIETSGSESGNPDDGLEVFSDLEAVFKNDNSKNLEKSFKQFGDSLKQIGDQIKAGIKKLSNDSSLPKVDLEKMKDWGLTQVKVLVDKAQSQAIDATKTANTAIDDTATKTKEATKAVHEMASEAAKSMETDAARKAAKSTRPVGAGKSEREQLIEQLRALQANRAARYRSVSDESSPGSESQDKHSEQTLEQLQEILKSLDPEAIQDAFDEIKKGIDSLKSKFETMVNSIKDDVEQSKMEDQTTGRTRRGVNFTSENFTQATENAFKNKDMNEAFEKLGKSFVDIIHQMKYNLEDVDKEIENVMAKHKATAEHESTAPLPKRSSEHADTANKESDDLKALRDALEKFKSTIKPEKIKAAFAKIEDTMNDVELEMKDEFRKFQTFITDASKEKNADAGKERGKDVDEPTVKENPVSERGLQEAPANADGVKEIGDELNKLYKEINPEAIRSAFNDLIDGIKSLGNDVYAGFDTLNPHNANDLSTAQRTLLYKIKRAIGNAKCKDEKDAQLWKREEQDVSKEGKDLEYLLDKLHEIQKSVNIDKLIDVFAYISKDIQRINLKLEQATEKIKKASDEQDIRRRTNTEEGGMEDQLEGALDAKNMNKKFNEFWSLIQNAIDKLKAEMVKTCNKVEETIKEKERKRSDIPGASSNDKDNEIDPEVIKIVAEIKDTFDPISIRKAFFSLHQELKNVGYKLEKALRKFEESVEKSRQKAHPVVRQVPMDETEEPSMDNAGSKGETMLPKITYEDFQQAIQDALNKLKKLWDIFKSGTSKMETAVQRENRKRQVSEAFDEIMSLMKNKPQRSRRDTVKQVEDNKMEDSVKPIDPSKFDIIDKFDTAFRWLEENLERIIQGFTTELDKLIKQDTHDQQRRENNKGTTITEEIEETFDNDKIAKAFEEVLEAFKNAKDKLHQGTRKAERDVSRLFEHLDYVKRVLDSDSRNNGAEELYDSIMKALDKIKSTFSRESLTKEFKKLDDEVMKVEIEANDAIKKMETWMLSKVDQAESESHQDTEGGAMRRGLPDSTDVVIDSAVKTMGPEKLEKLNTLMDLILNEGQEVASQLKEFGGKLKLPLSPVPTIPPPPPIKPTEPLEPMEPIVPMEPMEPMEPKESMEPIELNQPMKQSKKSFPSGIY